MKKRFLLSATALLASAAALLVGPPAGGAQGGSEKFRHAENAVPGQYIVVLKPEVGASLVEATSQSLAAAYGGQVRFTYEHALQGFSVEMTEEAALQLSQDSRVEFVEENGTVSANATQLNPPWGLDRIDQRFRPLDNTYVYGYTGAGVNAYVIDTGIRPTHVEFAPLGRAVAAADYAPPEGGGGGPPACSNVPPILCGTSAAPAPQDVTMTNSDCHGHGTHVAGTVGGVNYGVAKRVRLFGVRVLNCSGSGTYESVIAGVNWVTAHHQANPGPAVANMSLGGPANSSLDAAVNNSIASGVTYVVAAGNNNANASGYSPARVSAALTVGATDINDVRGTWFSNYGSLVDLHAPGINVVSAWHTSDTDTTSQTGTSMAAPHVAGVAALYLQYSPGASPSAVADAIVGNATTGVVGSLPFGTPNRLLYSRFIPDPPARETKTDFDADGQADLAVWRPGSGAWHIRYSSNNSTSGAQWGASGDQIVPGDYNGDGRADLAVWRPDNGTWYILNSSNNSVRYESWGAAGDIPVPGDYDGDGRTDIAVWRPNNGTWYIVNSSNGSVRYESWGAGSFGDKPVAADYDGDGRADLAVWRPGSGTWYISNSSNGTTTERHWGSANANDVLVPADYDGDGRADIAVWRPGDGTWYILNSSDGSPRYVSWGSAGDIPVAADYDGDGKADTAVWRPDNGTWYILNSSNGSIRYEQWGSAGDVPIPSAYNRY